LTPWPDGSVISTNGPESRLVVIFCHVSESFVEIEVVCAELGEGFATILATKHRASSHKSVQSLNVIRWVSDVVSSKVGTDVVEDTAETD
jgi:hypothetical protein